MKKETIITKSTEIIKETPTAWALPLIKDLENKTTHLAIKWVFSLVKHQIVRDDSLFSVFNDYLNIIERIINNEVVISPEKTIKYSREIFFLNWNRDTSISNLSNLYACEAHYLNEDYNKYIKNLNYITMTLNFDEANNKFINYLNEDCLYAIDMYVKIFNP